MDYQPTQTAETAWPLQTYLELAAMPSAAGCARGHVGAVAREWGLADLAEVAELLTSELVTNAIRASARASDPVRLWVASDQESLVICVWDTSQGMPARRDAGPDQENGRGLLLVETLGNGWGSYRESAGKVVWARVSR
jgi:anti-sigma regulatory factor (Ser/Thr protein kinase)